MAAISPELSERIEALYVAFAQVQMPERVEGCTNCCTSEAELAGLLAVPLRELAPEALDAYACNACDTVGSEPDFRYFLPRIFELAAAEAWGFPDGAWAIRRLRLTGWQCWDAAEQAAVRAFLMVWWREALERAQGFGYDEFDDVLATLLAIDNEPGPYLEAWLTAGPEALLRLARFVIEHLVRMQDGHEWNGWAPASATPLLLDWLCGRPVFEALSVAMEAEAALERLELVSDAWVLLGHQR